MRPGLGRRLLPWLVRRPPGGSPGGPRKRLRRGPQAARRRSLPEARVTAGRDRPPPHPGQVPARCPPDSPNHSATPRKGGHYTSPAATYRDCSGRAAGPPRDPPRPWRGRSGGGAEEQTRGRLPLFPAVAAPAGRGTRRDVRARVCRGPRAGSGVTFGSGKGPSPRLSRLLSHRASSRLVGCGCDDERDNRRDKTPGTHGNQAGGAGDLARPGAGQVAARAR